MPLATQSRAEPRTAQAEAEAEAAGPVLSSQLEPQLDDKTA